MNENLLIVLSLAGGLFVGWLAEQYAIKLQERIVVGWCKEFTRLAASES